MKRERERERAAKKRRAAAAEKKRRSLAAKKAAKTRAKNKRAVEREVRKTQREAKKLAKKKRVFEQEHREATTREERAQRERERVREFTEPGRVLGERFEKTILKRFLPEKDAEQLTPDQVKTLRFRAWKVLKKKLREAIKEAEETGEIQKPRGGYNKVVPRDAFRTTGSSINLKIRKLISESRVEDILYRVAEAMKKMHEADPRRLWYVTAAISSLGRKLYVGATIKFKDSKDPVKRLIMLESFPSTGLWDTMAGTLAALREKLEDLIDAQTMTLVRYVSIRHFDMKTKDERTAWKKRMGEEHAPEPTEAPLPRMKTRRRSKRK